MVRKSLLHSGRGVVYLEELATRSGYEGKGIVKALINYVVTQAKEKIAIR